MMYARFLALGFLGLVLSSGVVRAQPMGVSQELIGWGRTDYAAAVGGPADVYVGRITMEPGSSYGGWHTHPGAVWVVITAGELAVYGPDACRTVYREGMAYLAEPDALYDLRNETMGPVELAYAGVIRSGEAGTIPAEAPMATCG